MVEAMLFLTNQGVENLRLNAVAFIWKHLGTNCENQRSTHTLICAFNTAARIKSEAIVHPDEVAKYIDSAECQFSHNLLLMAMLWNTLASRQTYLLEAALTNRSKIDSGCAWGNYVRCHDDVGWTFSDGDAV